MTTELQQVLESITRLETKTEEIRTELKAELKEAKLDAKLFDTKFNYYQQATQWVIILSFSLILAATGITIFSAVFAFR